MKFVMLQSARICWSCISKQWVLALAGYCKKVVELGLVSVPLNVETFPHCKKLFHVVQFIPYVIDG